MGTNPRTGSHFSQVLLCTDRVQYHGSSTVSPLASPPSRLTEACLRVSDELLVANFADASQYWISLCSMFECCLFGWSSFGVGCRFASLRLSCKARYCGSSWSHHYRFTLHCLVSVLVSLTGLTARVVSVIVTPRRAHCSSSLNFVHREEHHCPTQNVGGNRTLPISPFAAAALVAARHEVPQGHAYSSSGVATDHAALMCSGNICAAIL